MSDLKNPVINLSENVKKTYKGLVFSGGGLMGFAYIGCLRALEEYGLMGNNIEFLAGCSIGAVLAAIISVEYTSGELYDFVLHFEYEIIKDLNFIGLIDNYGVETGNKIQEFMRIMLKRKTGIENPTFMDLYKKYKRHLVINATCVNTRSIEYFDWKSSPDMPVALALRMSISIPFLFVPVKYNGKLYVDGGVIDNFPLHLCSGDKNCYNKDEILGFKLEGRGRNMHDISSFMDFIHNTWRSQYGELLRMQMASLKDYPFVIIPLDGRHTLNLAMTKEQRIHIYNQGYKHTKKYLNNVTAVIAVNENNLVKEILNDIIESKKENITKDDTKGDEGENATKDNTNDSTS